jgi:hypothetical protein
VDLSFDLLFVEFTCFHDFFFCSRIC